MQAALVEELGEDPEESELRCRTQGAMGHKGGA
jgi:hypothetical protein